MYAGGAAHTAFIGITVVAVLLGGGGQVYGQGKGEDKDLDKLIDEIYGQGGGGGGGGGEGEGGSGGNGAVTTNPRGPTQAPSTEDCECVPYYLCNNGTIKTDGEGIIDIRINDGPCEGYMDQCCKKGDITDKPITPTPPPVTITGCGLRNPDGVGFRITGDEDNEAQFAEFPWMVAILTEQKMEGSSKPINVYKCGGALIHPSVVLTAAHCVANNVRYKIRAGEWDTQTTKELYPHQDRTVEKVERHPDYYSGALYNDVALLFLSKPVDPAENIGYICLPPQGTVTAEGTRCFATGWGKDVFGKEGKYQVILKKIDLPIVPHVKCQVALRKTRLGKYFELHKSFVCAGGEPKKDTCKGDGGSPLVCPVEGHRNRFYQTGTVAWGIGCGEDQIPGVYGNVALFRDWIDGHFKKRNLGTESYTIPK